MATSTETTTAPTSKSARKPSPGHAAVAGMLAAALALGVTEFLAGLVGALPSLVVLVGSSVIDLAPPAVEDFAIETFGTNDKAALLIGITILSLGFGAGIGLLARRRLWWGVAGLAVFGVLGPLAALSDPRVSSLSAGINAAVGVAAGAVALAALLRRAAPRQDRVETDEDRRGFLGAAAGVAATAVMTALGGNWLLERTQVVLARSEMVLPPPDNPLPPAPDAASLEVEGIAPLYTPNEIFYRIDTALRVPRVDPTTWRMRVGGMVDTPYELTFADLLGLPQVERDITLACVSNPVGGHLVGNARWQGVVLRDIIERAGVQEGATQIVGRAVDGFTVGFPTATVFDGRDALVAVGMNGEPLPIEHGFPARLVVAGLYGYVSATKWLSEIELATLDGFDAYWVPRGWSKLGPVKTQSRIDVPASGGSVPAGPTAIAGVAWAPNRGIQLVEVRVDDGPWAEAELAAAVDEDMWRQWVLRWDAPPGEHLISTRATDGTGETQTAEEAPPRPDGASGYHTIRVLVV